MQAMLVLFLPYCLLLDEIDTFRSPVGVYLRAAERDKGVDLVRLLYIIWLWASLLICRQGKGTTINYMLCIIASELYFSGASAARWWRLECKRLFCYFAKSVTEKNNSRVDCAEADKKTVQAQRYEGRGFLAAGDCLPELPVII